MIKKIEAKSFKSSNWSGGVTNELYIFPETAMYSKRDFNFRLSIATTDVEESTFTSLPNIERFLSILKGSILLEHVGRYSKNLSKYEIERFDGGWTTRAKGKVTDFNLMLKNCSGNLKFKENNEVYESTLVNKKFLAIYCIEGSLEVNGKILNENELLVAENEDLIFSSKKSKIFIAEIYNF